MNSPSSFNSDSSQSAGPGDLARKLGYAGLLPFVAGTLFIFLLAGRMQAEPFNFLVMGLTSYAALIVAFLGGVPWGLIMRPALPDDIPPAHLKSAIWSGVIYVTLAWVAVMMPPHAGLVVLGVLLIACYLTDRKRYPELGAAGWLTLRFRLTSLASLSCFLAAAQI